MTKDENWAGTGQDGTSMKKNLNSDFLYVGVLRVLTILLSKAVGQRSGKNHHVLEKAL